MFINNIENTLMEMKLDKNVQYAIAFSGGVDSVVLNHVLTTLGYSVIPLMFNHKLRTESDYEEEYFKNNIPNIIVGHWDSPTKSELDARNARYNFFDKTMDKLGIETLFVGHHGNDRAEEFLKRVVTGTTISGIFGMKKLSFDNLLDDKLIIRPMLGVLKKDIYSYAETNNLIWFEDKTNAGKDFTRNRFRNEYIPMLEKENVNTVEHVVNISDELEDVYDFLNEYVNEKYSKNIKKTIFNQNYLPISLFKNEKNIIKKELLKKFINESTEDNKAISKKLFNDYLEFICNSEVNKLFGIKSGFNFLIDSIDGELVVIIIDSNVDCSDYFPNSEKGKGKDKFGSVKLKEFYRLNKIPYYIRQQQLVYKENEIIFDVVK